MTVGSDEKSVQDAQPRDLYLFTVGTATYRLCGGDADIEYDGHLWTKETIGMGEAAVSEEVIAPKSIEITMPMKHPIPQRWMALATPPKVCSVTVYRYMVGAAAAETIWAGDIASLAYEDHLAKFLVPSRASVAMGKRLPTVTAGRQCGHTLYDTMCTIDRDDFSVTADAIQVDGRRVKVDLGADHASPWAIFGDVYHSGSGERMDIVDQEDLGPPSTVVWLTMQAPIVGLKGGDSIVVSAGCDHSIATCKDKFDNKDNFGNAPQLPDNNPTIPTGSGIQEQT